MSDQAPNTPLPPPPPPIQQQQAGGGGAPDWVIAKVGDMGQQTAGPNGSIAIRGGRRRRSRKGRHHTGGRHRRSRKGRCHTGGRRRRSRKNTSRRHTH